MDKEKLSRREAKLFRKVTLVAMKDDSCDYDELGGQVLPKRLLEPAIARIDLHARLGGWLTLLSSQVGMVTGDRFLLWSAALFGTFVILVGVYEWRRLFGESTMSMKQLLRLLQNDPEYLQTARRLVHDVRR